jgi:hypothetical protein
MAVTAFSQWTALTNLAPGASGGGMLLLSDGTVLIKSQTGGAGYGNQYYKLTPDINGSYVNGTWTAIAPMIDTRLYYSSQVLKDGRVYVAGGEYGTGGFSSEVYDPITNIWTATNNNPGPFISDANSSILDDGRVLQSIVGSPGGTGTSIYDPVTNTYIPGPACLGSYWEAAWIKLPDNSELFADLYNQTSERYIPTSNLWVNDGLVPVNLFDPWGSETGGALLLPDGRALFLGGYGQNAYYTPSGNSNPGIWNSAPDFPDLRGAPDAPAAMMANGKVLCDASPRPTQTDHYPKPTYFYEFDPVTNVFTSIPAPDGSAYLDISTYTTTLLTLPDGNILFAQTNSNYNANQLYIYTPTGSPQNTWRPVINTVTPTGPNTFLATGTQFNGISEGATYGDDWQMNSNYPLVRLVSGTNVYYARTSNWNSTGVMRGSALDNVTFALPAGMPAVTYSLYVVVNGIESLPFQFSLACSSNITISGSYSTPITQSSTWIKTSIDESTTILNTAAVKLDADPTAGYVELKPLSRDFYFLAAPSTAAALFVVQAFDGCGSGFPTLHATETPITTTKLINGTPVPPRRRHAITKVDINGAKNNTLEVFPNPAKGSFIIKNNEIMQNGKFQLFDINEKSQNITIENIDSYSVKIKWQYLSSGIYILKINSNKKTDFIKVVIQQ